MWGMLGLPVSWQPHRRLPPISGTSRFNGQSVYIKFNEADEGCRWNIKIDCELPGYNSPLLRDVNLCKVTDIRLVYDKASGVTSYQTR
jgi:hypothetical protein